MAAANKDEIILGSGHAYVVAKSQSVSLAGNATISTIKTFLTSNCIAANQIGHIKSGATLNYSVTTYTETDDFKEISKTKTVDEAVSLAFGLIDYKTGQLDKLIATATTDSTTADEVTYIGGIANDNGKSYYVIFKHEDAADSDLYCILYGRNIAALAAAFTNEAGTQFATEWQGEPFDSTGRKAILLRVDHPTNP